MRLVSGDVSGRRARSGGLPAALTPLFVIVGAFGSLLVVWWTSALILQGGASTPVAVGAALAIAVAAPVGLAVWKQGSPRVTLQRLAAVMSAWSLAILGSVGLLVADPLAIALRGHGWTLAAQSFGEDHRAARAASMLSHGVADVVAASEPRAPVDVATASSSINIDVTLTGPGGAVKRRYLWDTGATYTTLTLETARRLGIAVPQTAPRVTLDTAAGPRESTLVVLPKLQIGTHSIEGIAASICDTCAHDELEGLVGLNAMRHFVAELDGPAGTLRLTATPAAERTHDIAPFVDLEVSGTPTLVGNHVHWRIQVSNNSPRALQRLTPAVAFEGGQTLLGEEIATLAPGATALSRVKGRAGDDVSGAFTLSLHHAGW